MQEHVQHQNAEKRHRQPEMDIAPFVPVHRPDQRPPPAAGRQQIFHQRPGADQQRKAAECQRVDSCEQAVSSHIVILHRWRDGGLSQINRRRRHIFANAMNLLIDEWNSAVGRPLGPD